MIPPPIKLPDLSDAQAPKWGADKLSRKEIADALTCAIHCHGETMSIALNGVWGSGKTFLLKRWAVDLREQGFHVFEFNAWKDDFVNDPLIAIVGQFVAGLRWKDVIWWSMPDCKRGFLRWIVRTMWRLCNVAVAGLVKRFLCVDVDNIRMSDFVSATVKTTRKYRNAVIARDSIAKNFQRLANNNFEENRKPFVFIIDELDRCKPTFAIAVLERIKHVLNASHVVFVFGVDLLQLGKVIQSEYGDIDIENYLHRFFDLEFQLERPELPRYVKSLWDKYSLDEYVLTFSANGGREREAEFFKDMFSQTAIALSLSLREIEVGMRMFMMLLLSSGHDVLILPEYLIVLIIAKLRCRDLYDSIDGMALRPTELLDKVLPERIQSENLDATVDFVALVYAGLADSSEFDKLRELTQRSILDKDCLRQLPASLHSCDIHVIRHLVTVSENIRESAFFSCGGTGFEECKKRLECTKHFHYPR